MREPATDLVRSATIKEMKPQPRSHQLQHCHVYSLDVIFRCGRDRRRLCVQSRGEPRAQQRKSGWAAG